MKSALQILARQLRNPFLQVMLALTIVLAIVAIARTGLETLLLLSGVVVILFFGYLFFLRRESGTLDEDVFRELALRIIIAIKDEGYVPGNERQRDLGGALAAKVRSARSELAKRGGKAMAEEFIEAFDVPDSILE